MKFSQALRNSLACRVIREYNVTLAFTTENRNRRGGKFRKIRRRTQGQ